MVDGNLTINVKKFEEWMKVAELNETQFAKEIGVDQSNFSKMLRKEIPTPKHIIEKVLGRTLLPVNSILIFDSETNGEK